MIWTNRANLPEAVCNALTHNSYNGGDADFSATTLLKPPQMVQLERRYYTQITQDVIDNVWRLFGQAAHHILDTHAPEDVIAEERMYVDCRNKRIGGQVDVYHSGTITDYKITSAWSLVYGQRVHEWEQQLNIYAEIFRCNNYDVHALQIVAILRDWDKNKAKQQADYPQAPIVIIPLKLWDSAKAKAFIDERVRLHSDAVDLPDILLPSCSTEDMWEQAPKFAVMKDGAKRATKLFDDKDEATAYCSTCKGDCFSVQERKGKRVRCEDYCQVAPFCHQYRVYLQEKNDE